MSSHISLHANSVDVWTNPHLFRLHKQTGAPPDYFCTRLPHRQCFTVSVVKLIPS
jgi:hypothetical protein